LSRDIEILTGFKLLLSDFFTTKYFNLLKNI
jgi:hypothetical protein